MHRHRRCDVMCNGSIGGLPKICPTFAELRNPKNVFHLYIFRNACRGGRGWQRGQRQTFSKNTLTHFEALHIFLPIQSTNLMRAALPCPTRKLLGGGGRRGRVRLCWSLLGVHIGNKDNPAKIMSQHAQAPSQTLFKIALVSMQMKLSLSERF